MKGYLYIHEGKVCVNPEREPDKEDLKFYYKGDWYGKETDLFNPVHYHRALKAWEKNHVEVENAHVSQHPVEGHDEITVMKPVFQMAEIGQEVTYKLGEKAVITKIL